MEKTLNNTLMNNPSIRRLIETFAFFKANVFLIGKFLIISTLPLILLEIFLSYYGTTVSFPITIRYLSIIIGYLYQPIYTGGLIYLIYKIVIDEQCNIRECLSVSLLRWADLIIVNIISTVIIIAGLFAFIIPGFIAFARLSLAEYSVIINNFNPKKAIMNSNDLAKQFTRQIIGSCFLLSGILLIIELLIQIIINKLSIGNIFISAVSSLISIILWSNFTILLFRYYDLASKNNEPQPEDSPANG